MTREAEAMLPLLVGLVLALVIPLLLAALSL